MKALALFLTVTCYVPANPTGATGQPILQDMTCAVSQDMRHLLGRWIHIHGLGDSFVNDIMPRQWKQKLDVAVDTRQTAREYGRRKAAVRVVE